ncbi:DJ-1/PfpI family protein [Saccharopolyspora erythraea]|uniref:DJ-1/PfpI family protein n=1 Tax=Saccharopolyspora erythraea TaxID=1836 RepID=UPI001BAC83A1|nr:DJ-1/PfpI family protein [Saccharopolyspora erythraea]QUH02168.1 DJ-1/PfpI family protein [Saccharopolyspora erythraea]
MDTPKRPAPPALEGARIGILLESDYVEEEISYYRMRFAEEGAEVALLTRLWGNQSLVFTGHEHGVPLTVDRDLEQLDYGELSRLSALIVPSGMVADRLRYTEDLDVVPPALRLLQRAFRMPRLLKVFSCHGLWLVSAAPELVAGRSVTCHNNLVGDVRNMGAHHVDEDVVVDGDLITGRSVEVAPQLARTLIGRLAAAGR